MKITKKLAEKIISYGGSIEVLNKEITKHDPYRGSASNPRTWIGTGKYKTTYILLNSEKKELGSLKKDVAIKLITKKQEV